MACVDTLRGDVVTIAAAGANAQFVAPLSPEERSQYNAAFPNRFAFKHAFSRQNPERDWGTDVLLSIQFAFYVLNQKFPGANISKRNTIVIASSASNGGGASLRAIEQDHEGLIDGTAVSEPNVNSEEFRAVHGRPGRQSALHGAADTSDGLLHLPERL